MTPTMTQPTVAIQPSKGFAMTPNEPNKPQNLIEPYRGRLIN